MESCSTASSLGIDTIPNDVLYDVFLILVRGIDGRYPWNLASVCRRWRDLCLQSPILWSYVEVTFDRRNIHRCRVDDLTIARLQLQLDRSASAPLFIHSGEAYCTKDLLDCAAHSYAFQLLLEHSHRWATMESYSTNCSTNSFRDLEGTLHHYIPPNTDLTALRKVRWSDRTRWSLRDAPDLRFITPDAFPALTVVALKDISTFEAYRDLPWEQLTSFSLYSENRKGELHLIQTISRCQNLRSLSLSVPKKPDTLKREEIILPHLTNLRLDKPKFVPHFLPKLRLPSIQSIALHCCHFTQAIQHTMNLLQRSSSQNLLSAFSITAICLKEEAVKVSQLLEMCPNIQALSLIKVGRSVANLDALLQRLLIVEGSEPLSPRLRELKFSGYKFDMTLMIQMIDSRIKTDQSISRPTSLQSMHITLPRKEVVPLQKSSAFRDLLHERYAHGQRDFIIQVT